MNITIGLKAAKTLVTNKVGMTTLMAQAKSPQLLFGAGVVGVVGTVVLASRATLRVEEILDAHDDKKHSMKQLFEDPTGHTDPKFHYSAAAYRSDMTLLHTRTALGLVKLYTPAILVGGLSIAALTGSHYILSQRNAGLMAAYAAVSKGFEEYRSRVVADVGEDKDREYRYGSDTISEQVVKDNGKTKTVERKVAARDGLGAYAQWFDRSNKNWEKNPGYNVIFLRFAQNYLNDRLQARGHVFLNEAYDQLGLPHTTAGAVTGWRKNGEGDGYIDFGCWDSREMDRLADFAEGIDNAIMLDFNVDGVIYQDI